eukprot:355943-Chlamydomonas_euryale.AAC.11
MPMRNRGTHLIAEASSAAAGTSSSRSAREANRGCWVQDSERASRGISDEATAGRHAAPCAHDIVTPLAPALERITRPKHGRTLHSFLTAATPHSAGLPGCPKMSVLFLPQCRDGRTEVARPAKDRQLIAERQRRQGVTSKQMAESICNAAAPGSDCGNTLRAAQQCGLKKKAGRRSCVVWSGVATDRASTPPTFSPVPASTSVLRSCCLAVPTPRHPSLTVLKVES